MTSRETRQTYTSIHTPGERWRLLHVHFLDILIYTYTHLYTIFNYNYYNYCSKIVIILIEQKDIAF